MNSYYSNIPLHFFYLLQMEMNSTDTAFKLFDKDKDGFITRAEFAKVPNQIFIVSASPISVQGVQEDDQGADRGGLCQVWP